MTSTDSGAARGDGPEFGGVLEKQDPGIAQGNGVEIGDVLEKQSGRSLDGTVLSETQADNALDWTISVGFLPVEADVPAAGDVSSGSFDHGMTADIQVHAVCEPSSSNQDSDATWS